MTGFCINLNPWISILLVIIIALGIWQTVSRELWQENCCLNCTKENPNNTILYQECLKEKCLISLRDYHD